VVTGRRRVGKSRLVQEFCDQAGVVSVTFQATFGRTPQAERADLMEVIVASGLDKAELLSGVRPTDWNQALRALAVALPGDVPSIVVLDEIPWLMAQDPSFEGALQTIWDRYLAAKPVLLLLIGSDQSVMEGLRDSDRPFFGRASLMRVDPLNPADVQSMMAGTELEAIDAWLITGGFPQITASWREGESRRSFLRRALSDPLSPLLVSAELSLLGEFPRSLQARAVLEAIGTGETTFSTIAQTAGGAQPLLSGTLSPLLTTLVDKRVVAVDSPLSTGHDSRNRRYRVADSYLRFWLAFGAAALPLAERGLGDLAFQRLESSWNAWRGRAVEPLIRESLQRILMSQPDSGVAAVGAWWNRRNNPEIDLVGADQGPVAKHVRFIGSIKWREQGAFTRRDLAPVVEAAHLIPGATEAQIVAVSANGVEPGVPLAQSWGPEDIVAAWRD
jgi:AAA+ ATPase superfamily predicted ATPase